MSAHTSAQPIAGSVSLGLRNAALAIGGGIVVLGLLFYTEVGAAVRQWYESTAYNHCFLVLPIAAYLLWDRRAVLKADLAPAPIPMLALAGLPLAAGWLAAERLGIMEGRQLIAVSFAELLVLTVLGWRLWWLIAGPLLYLYFLVPFGEFLVPRLQDITTVFVRHGLEIINIPAYVDGYTIEIPEGTFYVAEACAGLRFLIASIAFGVLYALLMYRSPARRAMFIAASIVTPIVANGFRALGIVVLGRVLGSAQAAAADHVLYGWIFFSIVILALIAAGLPFRQDTLPHRLVTKGGFSARGRPRGEFAAAGLVVIAAVLSPAVGLSLDYAHAPHQAALPPLDFAPACTSAPAVPTQDLAAPGVIMAQRVSCSGIDYDVRVEVLSPYSTAAPVFAAARSLAGTPPAADAETTWLHASAGQRPAWRLIRTNEPPSLAATSIWIEGEPVQPGMTLRLRLAINSITGSQIPPVIVTIVPAANVAMVSSAGRNRLEQQLIRLISEQSRLAPQLRRIAEAAR